MTRPPLPPQRALTGRGFTYFGAYGLVTLDMDGKPIWERRFPVEDNGFGTGSSPILHEGTLYLVRDVAGLSTVHAFDPATGKERWASARPKASSNYSSPFIWERDDRSELIVAGSAVLESYDASSGEPLWWVENQTVFACPSPTAGGDTLFFGGWSTPNAPPTEKFDEAFEDGNGITPEIFADPEGFVKLLDKNGDGTLQQDELPTGRAQDAFVYLDFDHSGTWDLEEILAGRAPRQIPGRNVLVAIKGGQWQHHRVPRAVGEDEGLALRRLAALLQGPPLLREAGRLRLEHECPDRLGVGGEYYATPVGVGDRVLIGSVRGTLYRALRRLRGKLEWDGDVTAWRSARTPRGRRIAELGRERSRHTPGSRFRAEIPWRGAPTFDILGVKPYIL